MGLSLRNTVGTVAAHPQGMALIEEFLPTAVARGSHLIGFIPLSALVNMEPSLGADAPRQARFAELLAAVEVEGDDAPPEEPIVVSTDYEAADVTRAGAPFSVRPFGAEPGGELSVYRPVELIFDGPRHGNPFVDVEFSARVTGPNGTTSVSTGFYDGEGTHLIRVLPQTPGRWSFETSSNARSLDGIRGDFEVSERRADDHGPVRVDGFGFRHADGTRHLPLGTTAYAWTHQPEPLQEQTLATLADGPFTKLRMCVFPKSYLFNTEEPQLHAFERGEDGRFDTTRFIPEFFRHLERRIAQLGDLGIEADLILFHPYDRWGYADLGPVSDDRYTRYVVARLSALPNVWWSMANEFDLMAAKDEADWDRLARVVQTNDPVGHLLGIHNCMTFFDNDRDWVTHSSVQRVDVYRTAENVDEWRARWGKPVVVDECAYEGDIDQGWGNVTAEEMTRRFWEAAVRGGWCGHGETYWSGDDVLWWSKGGVFKGGSPARIAFLRRVLEEAPGDLELGVSDWDVPTAVVGDSYRLTYFSFMRPSYRTFVLPPDTRWRADVLDTWNMTVEPVPGELSGVVRIDLPGRQYIAVRMVRCDD